MTKGYRVLSLCFVFLLVFPAASHATDLKDLLTGIYTADGQIGIQLAGESPESFSYKLNEQGKLVTLNSLIATELAVVPLSSAVANIGIEFDPATGLPRRTTESYGPVFAERAQTIGRGKFNIGMAYTRLALTEFDGGDVELQLSRISGVVLPEGLEVYEQDQLHLSLDIEGIEDVFVLSFIYGVTENFDLGVLIPFINLDYKVEADATVYGWSPSEEAYVHDPTDNPVHYFNPEEGGDSSHSEVEGNANGIGDVVLRAKYFIGSNPYFDVAAAVDFKLPTGDDDDLLGTGDLDVTPFIILSKSLYNGRFNPHINFGYEINGTDSELNQIEYIIGFDSKITEKITGGVEFIGYNELDGDDVGDNIYDACFGLKYNPLKELVVYASVQIPLNDEGLRAEFIPTLGFQYIF